MSYTHHYRDELRNLPFSDCRKLRFEYRTNFDCPRYSYDASSPQKGAISI